MLFGYIDYIIFFLHRKQNIFFTCIKWSYLGIDSVWLTNKNKKKTKKNISFDLVLNQAVKPKWKRKHKIKDCTVYVYTDIYKLSSHFEHTRIFRSWTELYKEELKKIYNNNSNE